MKLSPERIDTIIAALRMWQSDTNQPHRDENDIATNAGAHPALNDEEIDELCEELNFAATIELSEEEDEDDGFDEQDDFPEPGDIRETGK